MLSSYRLHSFREHSKTLCSSRIHLAQKFMVCMSANHWVCSFREPHIQWPSWLVVPGDPERYLVVCESIQVGCRWSLKTMKPLSISICSLRIRSKVPGGICRHWISQLRVNMNYKFSRYLSLWSTLVPNFSLTFTQTFNANFHGLRKP